LLKWVEILFLQMQEKDKHFDPYLVDLLINNKEKFIEIRERLKDEISA